MIFTQFIFPNGRQSTITFDADWEIEDKAKDLVEAGWQFQCECNPNTGLVMADCCDYEGQLACTVIANGPAVPDAISQMVEEAYQEWLDLGKPEANTGNVSNSAE